MSKEIEISVKNIENLEFSLTNDAKKNDYVCLHNINKVDFSKITNELNLKRNQIIEDMKKRELPNLKNSWASEFRETDEKYQNLLEIEKDQKANIEKHKREILEAENQIETLYVKKTDELKEKINYLESEKHVLKPTIIAEFKKSEEYKIEISNAQMVNDRLIAELKLQKEDLDTKNKRLERIQLTRTIKSHGENLEEWMLGEYDKVSVIDHNTNFLKITSPGTKADFLYKIFDSENTLISTVVLEAKTEFVGTEAKNRHKNENFFDKLEQQRKKNNAEYSLLVTELESDKDFIIYKAKQYQNMYVVRPAHFLLILHLIKDLVLTKMEITNSTNVNFKEKKIILDEFEDLKEKLIQKISDAGLKKSILDLKKHAETIEKANDSMLEKIHYILNIQINKIRKTIEKFKISAIVNNV